MRKALLSHIVLVSLALSLSPAASAAISGEIACAQGAGAPIV